MVMSFILKIGLPTKSPPSLHQSLVIRNLGGIDRQKELLSLEFCVLRALDRRCHRNR